MKSRHIMIAALAASMLCTTGCAGGNGARETARETAVAPYSVDSLRNYQAARDYSAQGRYELAREHYLLALAATTDPFLQDALAQELESVNMMIKTLR